MSAIVEYSKTEAALADLATRYKGVVFEVLTVKGMDAAKKARAELRDYRTSLESKRVEIKAPALERCRLIDAEAKRITSALVALEDPIDAQIKAQEARRDAEKKEKERLEAERIAAEERAKKEAEEARMAAERAEIARQRAELEEAGRQARLKIEEEQRAARLKIEEEERKSRAAREEADRAARKVLEEKEAQIKAERDRLEAERRAAEDAQRKLREEEEAKQRAERARAEAARLALEDQKRKEREAKEAKEREVLRKQNELLDARQMLSMFLERFGHLQEFSTVCAAIIKATQKKAA